MADFFQNGLITTLHDLRATDTAYLEPVLMDATRHFRLGLILPVTASDMRAEPFSQIIRNCSKRIPEGNCRCSGRCASSKTIATVLDESARSAKKRTSYGVTVRGIFAGCLQDARGRGAEPEDAR